jgi:hypothetical protein
VIIKNHMAIERVGHNSAEASTVTIPAGHKAGDIILIFAYRDGSATNPTIPAGWTKITNTLDGTSCSVSIGWKVAQSGSETSGTWTNATHLQVIVYRGVDPITPFGALTSNAGTTSPSTYGATTGITKWKSNETWFAAFQGHRSVDTTTLNGNPTNYTNLQYLQGATSDSVSFDTNGPVSDGMASNTVAPGGTASGWITAQLPVYPAVTILNNFQFARAKSAGIISMSERIR